MHCFVNVLDDAAEAVEEATNGQQRPTLQSLGKTPRVCISGGNCVSGGVPSIRPKIATASTTQQEPAKSLAGVHQLPSVPSRPTASCTDVMAFLGETGAFGARPVRRRAYAASVQYYKRGLIERREVDGGKGL